MKTFIVKNKNTELEIYPFDSKNNLTIDVVVEHMSKPNEFVSTTLTQSEVYDLVEFLKKQLEEIN